MFFKELYKSFMRSTLLINSPVFRGTKTIPLQSHFFANSLKDISSSFLSLFQILNFCNALIESMLTL